MESYKLTVNNREDKIVLSASSDRTILQILRDNGLHMSAPCGGRGSCGKCVIRILDGNLNISQSDTEHFSEDELRNGYRLACVYHVDRDTEVIVKFENSFEVLTSYGNGNSDNSCSIPVYHGNYSMIHAGLEIEGSFSDHIQSLCPGMSISKKALHDLSELISLLEDKNGQIHVLNDGNKVLGVYSGEPPILLGIAIDIGTTTICLEAVDLLTGKPLGGHARINRQRQYGSDVISRIQNAENGNLDELHSLVTEDITSGIGELCVKHGFDPRNVQRIVIAGNTTMLHLLFGICCGSLGRFPFTPVMTNFATYHFHQLFTNNICDCDVTILPSISAYVGADITSGIVFCGGMNSDEISLLVDLGTNGEMALFSKNGVLCTSTAAGPAFEGGNISCGTGSIPGAISSASYEDGTIIYGNEQLQYI